MLGRRAMAAAIQIALAIGVAPLALRLPFRLLSTFPALSRSIASLRKNT